MTLGLLLRVADRPALGQRHIILMQDESLRFRVEEYHRCELPLPGTIVIINNVNFTKGEGVKVKDHA